MTRHRIVSVERIDNIAVKVVVMYESIEISFAPDVEKKELVETNRIHLSEDLSQKEKTWIPDSAYKAITRQVRAILFQKKKKQFKKMFIPHEDKIIEEATLLNNEVNHLKEEKKNKSYTEIVETILKRKATPIKLFAQDIPHLHRSHKSWLYELSSFGIQVSKEGWLIFSSGERNKKSRYVIFDIDTFIRMQNHILDSYVVEIGNLSDKLSGIAELQQLTKRINSLLLDWAKIKNNKNVLKLEIENLISELSRCRNVFKIQAKELAESISGLEDSIGRENPGAFAAKTIAILNRLEKRLQQVEKITPIIKEREKSLKKCRSLMEAEKLKAISEIENLLKIRNFSYYLGVNDIRINKILYILQTLFIEPFQKEKSQAAFYLSAAKDCITETKKAKKYIKVALSVLKG